MAGLSGATGDPRGRLGRAAGHTGVPAPPRPTDLIQFLMSRGGLKDEGGELRALDLHNVNQGHFGRLSRSNGMALDDARVIAVEAGYLHPDSDINDLLSALRRNAQGQPVFNESDSGAVAWREFERAGSATISRAPRPFPASPRTSMRRQRDDIERRPMRAGTGRRHTTTRKSVPSCASAGCVCDGGKPGAGTVHLVTRGRQGVHGCRGRCCDAAGCAGGGSAP